MGPAWARSAEPFYGHLRPSEQLAPCCGTQPWTCTRGARPPPPSMDSLLGIEAGVGGGLAVHEACQVLRGRDSRGVEMAPPRPLQLNSALHPAARTRCTTSEPAAPRRGVS